MAVEVDVLDDVIASERPRYRLDEIIHPHLIPLGELLNDERYEKNIALAQEQLRMVSREALDSLARRHPPAHRRIASWLIQREYTKRRVPPVFRNLPEFDPEQPVTLFDIVAYDLEWISVVYPMHLPPFQRYRKFMNPNYFHSQVKYIFTSGLRCGRASAWRTVKGLGLSVEQQVECHILKGERIYQALQKYQRLKPTVRALLELRHTDRLLKNSPVVRLGAEDQTIIRRRTNIWFCAMLSEWSPSRTGRLYDALTGFPDHRLADKSAMSRQRAAKFIEDIRRDLPKDFLK